MKQKICRIILFLIILLESILRRDVEFYRSMQGQDVNLQDNRRPIFNRGYRARVSGQPSARMPTTPSNFQLLSSFLLQCLMLYCTAFKNAWILELIWVWNHLIFTALIL